MLVIFTETPNIARRFKLGELRGHMLDEGDIILGQQLDVNGHTDLNAMHAEVGWHVIALVIKPQRLSEMT